MDSAHAHARSSSSPSSVPGYASTVRFRQPSPPTPVEQTSSRQQRLMDSRNARFVGKKLSLNDLGTRFTQLIHANEEPRVEQAALRNQENATPTRQNTAYGLGKRRGSTRSLGILEEVSNKSTTRSLRKRGSIPVYLDTPERPLLYRSPASSPGLYQDSPSEGPSPIGFDSFQDSLNKMHLRETSGNEQRCSPLVSSPLNGSLKAIRKRRSMPFKPAFDTQEYINHIEQELQQARKELYSPNSNRSLKDQLKMSRNENERLRLEISTIRDAFETEVKHTVEHMMAVEAELKMKVRDLEEEVNTKSQIIQEFEYKHEDERLNCNTVETLKAVIERLEQEKAAMENENRNMSKRNEVLSELLAMSPTKPYANFELRSPVREKRAGRPMSMILPRLPSSPTFRTNSRPSSIAASPSLPGLDYFQLPTTSYDNRSRTISISRDTQELQRSPPLSYRARSRQSQDDDAVSLVSGNLSRTSSSPATWPPALPTSPTIETAYRQPSKRKPRKFMSGSTQLKPLLLPALTGENAGQSSGQLLTSPRSITSRDLSQESFDPTTYFLSKPEPNVEEEESMDKFSDEQTILAERLTHESARYQTFDEILAEHEADLDASLTVFGGEASEITASPLSATEIQRGRDVDESYVSHGSPLNGHQGAFQRTSHRKPSVFISRTQESPQRRNLSESLSLDFDVEALHTIDLPDTDFSPFPPRISGIDGCLYTDIPQPLFSPLSKASPDRFLKQISCTPFDGSPQRLNPRKRRQSRSIIDEELRSDGPGPDVLSADTESARLLPNLQQTVTQLPMNCQSKRLSAPSSTRSLTRSRSPLDLIQQRQFGARPLASLTIRTIYGTISRCTAYVRELKRDPLALARRVIANAWFSNWARFGSLSWWVLGLFISPNRIQKPLGWQWDQYDGEEIARAICGNDAPLDSPRDATSDAQPSTAPESEDPASEADDAVKKPGWGKSLLLWGKFSVAIMLAVGSAVVNGPGEVLQDGSHQIHLPVHADQHQKVCTDKRHKPRCIRSRPGRREGSPPRRRGSWGRNGDRVHPAAHADDSRYSPLSNGSGTPPFTFRSHRQLDVCDQREMFAAGDKNDTLRPTKAQKVHAADIFPANSPECQIDDSGLTDRLGAASDAYYGRSSADSGTLQWPPSPRQIHPKDSPMTRGQ